MSALEGKAALVTGGGRGLGRGFALRLARLGAAVTVADLDLQGAVTAGEAATDTLSELETLGAPALGIELDVGDRAAVEEMVAKAVERFGGLDVLICNAGSLSRIEESYAASASEESLRPTLETNFFGTVNCCCAAAPHLKAGGWGKVVNVSSLGALLRWREGLRRLTSPPRRR